jgi:hypothetical protein
LTRRVGISVVGLAAAATLVAGCSSSGGGKPSTNTSANGGGTTASNNTPAGGGGNTSTSNGGGGGGGSLSGTFCGLYDPSKLQTSSSDPTGTALAYWDQIAKNAPSDIKSDAQAVDKYLHAAAGKNYTEIAADAQKYGQALQAVSQYILKNCLPAGIPTS